MNSNQHYEFRRVTRQLPCPICAHDHWCLVAGWGDRAICCRTESETRIPSFDGWLHHIPPRNRAQPETIARLTRTAQPHAVRDFSDLLDRHIEAFDDAQRQRAAELLGLDACAFDPYAIGLDTKADALAIPALQLSVPTVIGIRYRALTRRTCGAKWWTERGSTAGLLLPRAAPDDRQIVAVCEGPSDTFAASQLGLHALGRWSCGLDERQLETLASHLAPSACPTLLVVGDNDGERATGQRGADAAARAIIERLPELRVLRVQPPPEHKDLRNWLVNGKASDADVISAAKEVARED
jgi:hypothetical protein